MSRKVTQPEVEEFLASLVGRSPATKRLYRIVLTEFFDYTRKGPDLLEAKDFQRFFQLLDEEYGYKKNTLRVYINTLRSFLRFLGREDLRKQIKSVKPPKAMPLVPRAEDIGKMIEAADTLRDKLIIQLLARTGLRLGELYNLNIQDVDLQNLRLVVRRHGQWAPKGAKERVVRFDHETATLIKKYISPRKEGLLLGITPSTIRAMIKKVARKAGVRSPEKITPHKLRHFFACDFLQRGGDIRSLQKLLGHAELSTTEIYLDYSFDMVSQAYNKAYGDTKKKKEVSE